MGFRHHEANAVTEEDITHLAKIADHPRVVVIGETRLDFYRNLSSRKALLQVLRRQLELGVKLILPVIIDCRQAEKDTLTLLRKWTSFNKESHGQPRGVIHYFSGDIDTARQCLDMGFFISLGAYIGYPSSQDERNTIRSLPQDRLVVETDYPFLPPQRHRGQRNEPAYLPLTTGLLVEIRGTSSEIVAREDTECPPSFPCGATDGAIWN